MINGEKLKKLRLDAGLTHEQLAEAIGVNTKQIWRYESGHTDPSSTIVRKLATVLFVSTDYLLDLSSNPMGRLNKSDLTEYEQEIIFLYRRGDLIEAIKTILSDRDVENLK